MARRFVESNDLDCGRRDGNRPSTPVALYYSYPAALIRLIAGLSAISDEAVSSGSGRRGWKRELEIQKDLAIAGKSALHSTDRKTMTWLRELSREPDILALLIGYCYFCGKNIGNLYHTLSRTDPALESLYEQALKRFPLEQKKPRKITEPALAAAEIIANSWALSLGARLHAVNSLLHAWSWGWAMEFVLELPLRHWTSDIDRLV